MSRPLLCLCPLEDVRRSGDSDNQEDRQTRGQAATDKRHSNFYHRDTPPRPHRGDALLQHGGGGRVTFELYRITVMFVFLLVQTKQ